MTVCQMEHVVLCLIYAMCVWANVFAVFWIIDLDKTKWNNSKVLHAQTSRKQMHCRKKKNMHLNTRVIHDESDLIGFYLMGFNSNKTTKAAAAAAAKHWHVQCTHLSHWSNQTHKNMKDAIESIKKNEQSKLVCYPIEIHNTISNSRRNVPTLPSFLLYSSLVRHSLRVSHFLIHSKVSNVLFSTKVVGKLCSELSVEIFNCHKSDERNSILYSPIYNNNKNVGLYSGVRLVWPLSEYFQETTFVSCFIRHLLS